MKLSVNDARDLYFGERFDGLEVIEHVKDEVYDGYDGISFGGLVVFKTSSDETYMFSYSAGSDDHGNNYLRIGNSEWYDGMWIYGENAQIDCAPCKKEIKIIEVTEWVEKKDKSN